MTKTITTCDACGKQIGGSDEVMKVRLPIRENKGKGEFAYHLSDVDLCRDCQILISDYYYDICKKHHNVGIMIY